MIAGRVSPKLEAVVAVTVRGRNRTVAALRCVVDTGFDGCLCVSSEQVAGLDLAPVGTQPVVLGDGSEARLKLFEAIVEWHGQLVPVPVLEVEGGALLGMALLHGSQLTMDVVDDGAVRIGPMCAP